MPYQTPFAHLVYPSEAAQPCSLIYRIAFTDSPDRLAIVHLRQLNPGDQSAASSSIVRDHITNRILESDLKGLPLNAVRLVVEDAGSIAVFAMEVDVEDYVSRGNPFTTSHVATAGGLLRESIAIQSAAVIAGSARISTAHASAEPLPAEIAGALS